MMPLVPPVKVDIDSAAAAAFIPWARRELERMRKLVPTGGRKYTLPTGEEIRWTWGPFVNHIRITSTPKGFGRYVFSKPTTQVSNPGTYIGQIPVFKGTLTGSKVLELSFSQSDNLVEWAHDYTTLVHINSTTNSATITRAGVSLTVSGIMSLTELGSGEFGTVMTLPLTHPDIYYTGSGGSGVVRGAEPVAPYYRQRHASISPDGLTVILRRSINDGSLLLLRWDAPSASFVQFIVPASASGPTATFWLNPFNGDVYQRMILPSGNFFLSGHLPIYKLDSLTGTWSLFKSFTFSGGTSPTNAYIVSSVVFEPTDQSAHTIWYEYQFDPTPNTIVDVMRDTTVLFPAIDTVQALTLFPPYIFIHGVGDNGRMTISTPVGNFWRFNTTAGDILQIGVEFDHAGSLSTKGTRWYKYTYSGALTDVYENGVLYWSASGADEFVPITVAPDELEYGAPAFNGGMIRPSFKDEDKFQAVYLDAGIWKATLAVINSVSGGPITLKKGPSVPVTIGGVTTYRFWHEDLIP